MIEQYKNEILSILSKKPVEILGKIPRVSFEQIEKIYSRLFKDFTDHDKSYAAIQHWLMTTEDRVGHTCAPKEKVIKEASIKANLKQDVIIETLKIVKNKSIFVSMSHNYDIKICPSRKMDSEEADGNQKIKFWLMK